MILIQKEAQNNLPHERKLTRLTWILEISLLNKSTGEAHDQTLSNAHWNDILLHGCQETKSWSTESWKEKPRREICHRMIGKSWWRILALSTPSHPFHRPKDLGLGLGCPSQHLQSCRQESWSPQKQEQSCPQDPSCPSPPSVLESAARWPRPLPAACRAVGHVSWRRASLACLCWSLASSPLALESS